MSKNFNIYACGGCGINVGGLLMQTASQTTIDGIKTIIGMDTSKANPVENNLFEVEKLPDATGSGGVRGSLGDRYPDFVKQMMAKYQPNDLNIVLFSLAGGSGSGMGPFIVRYMLQNKIPVLPIMVGDTTTAQEQINTVNGLRSIAGQLKLGHPILMSYYANTEDTTQGDVNKKIVQYIENAIVAFSDENERIDYADIKNFFYFTDVVNNAEPVISLLSFIFDSDIPNYERNPVAAISLYNDIDSIKAPFQNMLYRKAGLYPQYLTGKHENFHAVIDHGDAMDDIQKLIEQQRIKQEELSGRFRAKKTAVIADNTDDDGMFF